MASNPHFFAAVYSWLKGLKAGELPEEFSAQDFEQAYRQARASSGGKQRAENMHSMSEWAGREGGAGRVFLEAQFAEAPDKIQVLPRPGQYSHPKYGKIKLTREDIAKFVDNHNAHIYQADIPIDAEHETKLSGALGYIRTMELIDGGKGGAQAQVEWNDRGRTLMSDNRFSYFSPEWYDGWQDPATGKKHANVLVGGALTTRPFFKEGALRPLVAHEGERYELGEWVGEDTDRTLVLGSLQFSEEGSEPEADSFVAWLETMLAAEPEDMHVPGHPKGCSCKACEGMRKSMKKAYQEVRMAEEPAKGGEGAIDPQKFTELESQIKSFKEELDTERGLRQAAEGRVSTLEAEGQTRRFRDIIAGIGGENDGSPRFMGDAGKHEGVLRLIAKEHGEDSEEFKDYVALQRSQAELLKKAEAFSEIGTDSHGQQAATAGGAEKELRAVAQKLIDDGKAKTMAEAIPMVASSKEHAKLYRRYTEEQNRQAARKGNVDGEED